MFTLSPCSVLYITFHVTVFPRYSVLTKLSSWSTSVRRHTLRYRVLQWKQWGASERLAICFGCISFKDKSPDLPALFVRASRLNPFVSFVPISHFTCPVSFPLLRHLIARENHTWIRIPFPCPSWASSMGNYLRKTNIVSFRCLLLSTQERMEEWCVTKRSISAAFCFRESSGGEWNPVQAGPSRTYIVVSTSPSSSILTAP